jgi:hypothetical protein
MKIAVFEGLNVMEWVWIFGTSCSVCTLCLLTREWERRPLQRLVAGTEICQNGDESKGTSEVEGVVVNEKMLK